jgi:hypothetical protein
MPARLKNRNTTESFLESTQRFLFCFAGGSGHFHPLAPLAGALDVGLPMVVVPLIADQFFNKGVSCSPA